MKRYIMIPLMIVCLFAVMLSSGCKESSTDRKIAKQTEQMMTEANSQIGMPAIINWQEKKLAKMLFELRDKEDYICYAYIVNMHGDLKFIGRCIGYGLPYSVQFSNPEKISRNTSSAYGTLPQPEPNGLFMPEGLSATWLMLIDPKTNKPSPVYVEPSIMVSPFPLH